MFVCIVPGFNHPSAPELPLTHFDGVVLVLLHYEAAQYSEAFQSEPDRGPDGENGTTSRLETKRETGPGATVLWWDHFVLDIQIVSLAGSKVGSNILQWFQFSPRGHIDKCQSFFDLTASYEVQRIDSSKMCTLRLSVAALSVAVLNDKVETVLILHLPTQSKRTSELPITAFSYYYAFERQFTYLRKTYLQV